MSAVERDCEALIEAAKEHVIAEILGGAPERPIDEPDLLAAARELQPSTLDWLRTARNLVKYAGDGSYREVEAYLKQVKLL